MTPRKHTRPWYKQRVSSASDAVLFFLVFGIGVIGILWLKEEDYEQVTVTALPCGLLLLYAAIIKFLPPLRLREDQAGDNCYYLGFLFTLVSLALALAAFVEAGGTEEIIEDFGIALASTIIGLALRVAFNQMRQDPVEVDREARLELAAAAQRLRSELDESVIEMNTFRRATQQSIADGLEELSNKVGELLETNLARYDEVTTASVSRIDQTLASFVENAQSLNTTAEETIGAIEKLTERIKAIRAPEDLVESRLAPAASAVAEMVVELKQRAGAESREFRQLRKVIQGASAVSAGLEGHVAGIAKAIDGLKHFGETLEAAENRLVSVSASLEDIGKALMSSAEPAREVSAVLSAIASQVESLKAIESELERLPAALEEKIAALSPQREETAGMRRFFPFR